MELDRQEGVAVPLAYDVSVPTNGSAAKDAVDHRAEIRLWLRLLACTTLIGADLRRRFREEFDTTIPRFEILAQLDRQPSGLVLGELSKRLMVSPANLTPIIERLTKDGFITRNPSPVDRRIQIVCMTVSGQKKFRRMAKRHGAWLASLFEDYPVEDVEQLNALLGRLKLQLTEAGADSLKREPISDRLAQ